MFPLRPEVSLSPPTLHPCGHLSYAVHPLAVTMTVSSKDTINLPQQKKKKKRTPKRPRREQIQRSLLLSRLSVYEHGTSPSGRFITADASRLKEEEQTRRVCLPCVTWTDPPPWSSSSSSSCLLQTKSSHTNVSFPGYSVLKQLSPLFYISFLSSTLPSVCFSAAGSDVTTMKSKPTRINSVFCCCFFF